MHDFIYIYTLFNWWSYPSGKNSQNQSWGSWGILCFSVLFGLRKPEFCSIEGAFTARTAEDRRTWRWAKVHFEPSECPSDDVKKAIQLIASTAMSIWSCFMVLNAGRKPKLVSAGLRHSTMDALRAWFNKITPFESYRKSKARTSWRQRWLWWLSPVPPGEADCTLKFALTRLLEDQI